MKFKKLNKKLALIMGMLLIALTFSSIATTSYATSFATVYINLSDDQITVNGEPITEDSTKMVYLAHSTNNGGTSSDATSANIAIDNIVVIRACGYYEFTGSLSNGQIAIDFNEIDETQYESSGHVGIALNNVDITCKSAPAIFAYNSDVVFEGKELYIQTIAGSTNTITGGKIKQVVETWKDKDSLKYYVEDDEDDGARYKYDGAISSDVNVSFTGEGNLTVNSNKKEGIESKANISFESGDYVINSLDDGINASTDHKSVITINGGSILVNVLSEAEEGDGIDSNGTIVINGGTVVALASETSQDNGLDSDDGIYINGGYVVGTGNMADGVNSNSKQKYLQLRFNSKVNANTLITIADENDNPIAAYKTDRGYSILTISTPEITITENVKAYEGGTIEGESINGLYTKITSYEKGTEKEYGSGNGMMGPGGSFDRDMMDRRVQNVDYTTYYIILGILGGLLIIVIIIAIISSKKAKKE